MATETYDLTSQVDGISTSFALPRVILAGSLVVHYNGDRLRPGLEFLETSTQSFAWIVMPKFPAPQVGDTLQAQYEYLTGGDVYAFPYVVASGTDPTK